MSVHSYLERYQTDGLVVIPPILRPNEIQAAIRNVDELCSRAARDSSLATFCVFEKDQPKEKRGGIELDDDETAVFIVGDVPRFCPELLHLILKQEVLDLARDILGTRRIVAHFANLTMKSARVGSKIGFHRDYPNKFISPASPDMVRTMICLDGMSFENGATAFLPGSHKSADVPAAPIQDNDAHLVTAICDPGSVVALHPLVLHGGPPNFSSSPRRNIVVQWGREDVPLVTDYSESITGKTVQELLALLA